MDYLDGNIVAELLISGFQTYGRHTALGFYFVSKCKSLKLVILPASKQFRVIKYEPKSDILHIAYQILFKHKYSKTELP